MFLDRPVFFVELLSRSDWDFLAALGVAALGIVACAVERSVKKDRAV
jgi:hypothetical protein